MIPRIFISKTRIDSNTHESISTFGVYWPSPLLALLTGVIPPQKRSTAFGLFDTGYGIAWFLGSAAMGLLYEKSILAVVLFSAILQLAAIPVLFIANKKR
jgi:predicted MFS family arabinose efflux permease